MSGVVASNCLASATMAHGFPESSLPHPTTAEQNSFVSAKFQVPQSFALMRRSLFSAESSNPPRSSPPCSR